MLKKKNEWQFYDEKIQEFEMSDVDLTSVSPVEKLDESLIKLIPTFGDGCTDNTHPILATEGLYNCTGIIAYDLNKQYAHLGHSFPNQYCEQNRLGLRVTSEHALKIFDTLSKKELYKLKFIILAGKRANKSMINIMINSILALERKSALIESIDIMKTFIKEIHLPCDKIIGGSFAFDIRNGNRYIYNSYNNEYYLCSETSNALIKIR
jgi:hypothetical protein